MRKNLSQLVTWAGIASGFAATTFEVNVYSVTMFFIFAKMGTALGCGPVTMT
jgi:hypothetical protein